MNQSKLTYQYVTFNCVKIGIQTSLKQVAYYTIPVVERDMKYYHVFLLIF